MSDSYPVIENGTLAGNLYDKYGTKNPIVKILMNNFQSNLNTLVSLTNASKIHEVGCGEGNLSIALAKKNKIFCASDFSQQIISKARANAKVNGVDIKFKVSSIYDLDPHEDSADLIVCCEVLEHLIKPQEALSVLSKLADPYLIISVPREPLWRILNLARFKYVLHLGNTPGHIQHWSKRDFIRLLRSYFHIIEVLTPIPWTMALCSSRKI